MGVGGADKEGNQHAQAKDARPVQRRMNLSQSRCFNCGKRHLFWGECQLRVGVKGL